MGRKKKSATFQLMAGNTSDSNYSSGLSGDRVFFRVDNNQYTPDSFFNDCEPDAHPDSIFADAPEVCDDEDVNYGVGGVTRLPDHIRKEILELGFPDDGYNCLVHLREIKNTGGGSVYYQNPKANLNQLPWDVKAYDASRIDVSNVDDASEEKSIYNVASNSVGVRLQKALDPEVSAILDDSDSSKFRSDIEDLEEDFVVRSGAYVSGLDSEKPRVRCPLDEQFDLLELHEYGADSGEEYNGYMDQDECQESLTETLHYCLQGSSFRFHNREADDNESPELTAEVIRRCKEYAEKYEEDNHDNEEVLVEESSDESEVCDCKIIVSTYSTLDSHPGKIGAPEARRKKKLAETLSGIAAGFNEVITFKGKEGLPVDFLPRGKKQVEEKISPCQKVAAFTGPSSIHLM
ncbi:hypothetical protein CDL12_05346 [Handroanthus impetiginosus]|uniref:Uncharacterized protein n=1 Tax=Handroanthus impetiginosus TaxID=429701 RepID=A0A2G9HWS6_9LAMI|nr:hypothetical protein CDL12_05346 [Handroanthus impetiginosus]